MVYSMEKDVVDNQMKVDRNQRKFIKNAKQAQHDEAAGIIYGDIDEVNKLDRKLTDTGTSQLHDFEKKNREAKKKINSEETNDDDRDLYKKNKSGDIWETTDVNPNATKYSKSEEVGQCTVEEVEDEEEP